MKKVLLIWMLLGLVALGITVALVYVLENVDTHVNANSGTAAIVLAPTPLPIVKSTLRPRYPLSVIPGGVGTVAEFNMRVMQDPVLAARLACEGAHTETAPSDIVVFTTFRRGNKILWNRRPIAVKKGERLIVGCGRTVLMRCGNEISYTPQEPSESLPPGTLETPITPAPPTALVPPAETLPPAFHAGTPIETTENFGGQVYSGGGFYSGGGTTNVTSVPEPSTLRLFLTGFGPMIGFVAAFKTAKFIGGRKK